MGYLFHNPYLADRRQSRYCIVFFLPKQLNEMLMQIREKFDPSYNLIASHVTVVFPFETARQVDEIASVIESEVIRLGEFDISLTSLNDFYPEFPIIYWSVEISDGLSKLYRNITNGLGLTIPHEIYKPHVTLAQEISKHRVMLVKENIIPYISSETFKASSIDLISPMNDSRWVSVRTFKFKKPE